MRIPIRRRWRTDVGLDDIGRHRVGRRRRGFHDLRIHVSLHRHQEGVQSEQNHAYDRDRRHQCHRVLQQTARLFRLVRRQDPRAVHQGPLDSRTFFSRVAQ
jgi:hypothetical protein